MEQYRMGIDLGGTNLRVAVLDAGGTIIEEINSRTEQGKGPEPVIEGMIEICRRQLEGKEIEAIGIGAPGPMDIRRGVILSPPNLPGWDDVPLVKMLEGALGKRVVLDNDANAAALAEAVLGAGKGEESVFYMTISTGVGGGFIYKNHIIQGANFCTGEIGNMIVDREGPEHASLNTGSLETLASGTAVAKFGQEMLGISGHAGEVFDLAQSGDKIAMEIVCKMIDALAKGIANIVHIVDPDLFVLGGGVMQSEEFILPLIKERVDRYLYPQLRGKIKIVPAALGTKAGVIGAALLPEQN